MVQNRGTRFDTLATHTFATQWKAASSLGGAYTMVSFTAPDARPVARPSLTPTPVPSAAPDQTPLPQLLAPPAFTWQLPVLNLKSANRRAADRAGALLRRPGGGTLLLGADALDYAGNALVRAGGGTEVPDPAPDPAATPEAESPYDPGPGDVPVRAAGAPASPVRVAAFLGGPVREWAIRRREAAAFLEALGRSLGEDRFSKAAAALRTSAEQLEAANDEAPDAAPGAPTEADRARLASAGRLLLKARDAERLAARLLAGPGA